MDLLANATIDFTAVITVLLLYLSGRRAKQQDFHQAIFDKMQISLICFLLVDLLAWYVDGKRFFGAYAAQFALNTLVWLTQAVYSFLWCIYAENWIHPSGDITKKRLRAYAIPLYIEIGLLLANGFTGWLFRIEASHMYVRGELYLPAMVLFYGYGGYAFAISIGAYFRAKDQEQKDRCLWMACFMVLPAIFSVIRLFVYGITLISPFYALSLLMIYLNVHQRRMVEEQIKVAHRDADLQNARIAIMLSQIQPHFLYNALCVIQDLCHGKAPEAEQATIAFSRFLRGNLDSLKADKPIPFARELDHTKYYLTLEQMRFGERLKVAYDIQTDAFRLPAMTLQPIVENAVRYGVMKREAGGTVRITACETERQFTVAVADDGVGFTPQQTHADERTHIGIDNVRQRLREMCGGELTIASTPGEGTLATLVLPKGGVKNENSGA